MDIKAVLFDIDGVLTIGKSPITGAEEALRYVKSKGYKCRFITNTTTKSSKQIYSMLNKMSLPVERTEIFSAPEAAIRFLRKQNKRTIFPVLNEALEEDFSEFQINTINPDYIVIGDIDDNWSNQLMNELFRLIFAGAEIIALHKDKYWLTEKGLKMDIGAYIAGLEYVTGKKSIIIGKPSSEFFQLVIDDLKVDPKNVAVIGDDIETDIAAAQKMGMHGILVRTGKYNEAYTKSLGIVPKIIIDSIKDLPGYL